MNYSIGDRISEKDFSPVLPQRFVWHVGSDDPSVAASIERFGLLVKYSHHEAIFVNNQSDSLADFYPCVLSNLFVSQYFPEDHELPWDLDIWRIDTAKCNARWFFDPNMAIPELGEKWNSRYIFTTSNIPPHALARFRVSSDRSPRFVVTHGDGVSSIVALRLGLSPFPWREDQDQVVFERAA